MHFSVGIPVQFGRHKKTKKKIKNTQKKRASIEETLIKIKMVRLI